MELLSSNAANSVTPTTACLSEDFAKLSSGVFSRTDAHAASVKTTLAKPGSVAITANIDPANLMLLNDRLTQLRRRKEHLQRELRAARTAARGVDTKGLRKWAAERITGVADAMAGRRNEQVRRVIATYIDQIMVYPTTKEDRPAAPQPQPGPAVRRGSAPKRKRPAQRPVACRYTRANEAAFEQKSRDKPETRFASNAPL
jgi:hypothetical protein